MQPIYDMHCHYGFAPDFEELIHGAARYCVGAYSCGVTPFDPMLGESAASNGESDFSAAEGDEAITLQPAIRFGLGLHPWWVADGRCGAEALERFAELASQTRFIGEVGLDFGKKCLSFEGSKERQMAAFEAVLRACEKERKLLSIHAVQSAGSVLECLAESSQKHDVIFHWFSGTSEELTAAIKSGCFFSVNSRMLDTRRGREYARVIPVDQLLLETDAPAEDGLVCTTEQQRIELESLLVRLAQIRSVDAEGLGLTIAATSARLLTCS